MKKWHMIIDVSRCEDCNNCSLACKDEHVDNEWPGYSAPQPRHGQRWMNVQRKERGQFPLVDVVYRPTTCMQCADAPCVNASEGAIKRRSDGIVLIDPEKAKGQRQLVKSCPYEMIWWNEERQLPQKCTFCAHLLDDGWKEPRCVQACPTGALQVKCVEDTEMARIAQSEELLSLHPEYKTRPQVYYANLRRFDHCFIAGSIALERGGTVDCAPGATITLHKDGRAIAETVTDAFGDFRFDGLESNSTDYDIDIQLHGFGKRALSVTCLNTSLSLGLVCLAELV
jgi:Fe-S-cluster-containing dehydrogenase component